MHNLFLRCMLWFIHEMHLNNKKYLCFHHKHITSGWTLGSQAPLSPNEKQNHSGNMKQNNPLKRFFKIPLRIVFSFFGNSKWCFYCYQSVIIIQLRILADWLLPGNHEITNLYISYPICLDLRFHQQLTVVKGTQIETSQSQTLTLAKFKSVMVVYCSIRYEYSFAVCSHLMQK